MLLPLCALVVLDGVDSAWRSFLQGERWAGTGLPLQWAVRLWVPLGFALLMLILWGISAVFLYLLAREFLPAASAVSETILNRLMSPVMAAGLASALRSMLHLMRR